MEGHPSLGEVLCQEPRNQTSADGDSFVGERRPALSTDEGVGLARGQFPWPVTRVVSEASLLAAWDAQRDGDATGLNTDEVVGGLREATGAQSGDGARVD